MSVAFSKIQQSRIFRTRAWFNFSMLEGGKSWVAGVERAKASEAPVRKPRTWGRRPQPPLRCYLQQIVPAQTFGGIKSEILCRLCRR